MPSDPDVSQAQVQGCHSNQLRKYITRNSVYYVRDDVCLEVLERHSSGARTGHGALEQRLVACVRWKREGGHEVVLGASPLVGDSLLLGEAEERQILTSAVRRIEAMDASGAGEPAPLAAS